MMGRRRITRQDLPQRVYFNHGAYYFVTIKGEWIYLHRQFPKAMSRYAEIVGSPSGKGAMADLINRYLREVSAKKSPRTYKNNLHESKKLLAVFGDMSPAEITPQDIYAYMDKRGKPIAANREVSLLSTVFKYAVRWGLAADNPCRLVSKNPEAPRDREVQDWEYSAVHAIASPAMQCAMDIIDLTALRIGDVLSLNEREHITDDGIYIVTGKRKKKMLFVWTDDLRAIYERCRAYRKEIQKTLDVVTISPHLICNRMGQRYTVSGFESNWQQLMRTAIEKKVIKERFTCHDLRARAARNENATELLGHDDPRTTNRIYRRVTRKVTPNKPRIFGSET